MVMLGFSTVMRRRYQPPEAGGGGGKNNSKRGSLFAVIIICIFSLHNKIVSFSFCTLRPASSRLIPAAPSHGCLRLGFGALSSNYERSCEDGRRVTSRVHADCKRQRRNRADVVALCWQSSRKLNSRRSRNNFRCEKTSNVTKQMCTLREGKSHAEELGIGNRALAA